MKYNKKGLSDVVTTVLIILLVLAAIALIWGFLLPFFKNTGSQIGGQASCLNLQMEVSSCKHTISGTNITYRWVGGNDLELVAANVLVYDSQGANVVKADQPKTDYLASVTIDSAVANASAAYASVAGKIKMADGSIQTCPESTKVQCLD